MTIGQTNIGILLYKVVRFFPVAKDLAYCVTDGYPLQVSSHRSWEGLLLFWRMVPSTSQEKTPLDKNITPTAINF